MSLFTNSGSADSAALCRSSVCRPDAQEQAELLLLPRGGNMSHISLQRPNEKMRRKRGEDDRQRGKAAVCTEQAWSRPAAPEHAALQRSPLCFSHLKIQVKVRTWIISNSDQSVETVK